MTNMTTSSINISLPRSMKSDIEEIVANEGYGNTSEFFRDLVRDYLRKRQDEKLETLLLEAIQSGDPTPFTKKDLEEIKERGLRRLKRRAGDLERR